MARMIAIGGQDFGRIIENDYFYIDKSDFIKDWWENGDAVTLIARPRRFGKTLIMDMLYKFFSIRQEGDGGLFKNLNIWREEKYKSLQGTYPVIFMSFADIKCNNYREAFLAICRLIAREYKKHIFLTEDEKLPEVCKNQFYRVMNGNADIGEMRTSLNQLSEYLCHYYGKKVILLLDEYDTPMQEAYLHGYWEELTGFLRGFFNSTFKTNPYLERAIMTGITRVSKESFFSELNNLTVAGVTSRQYETAFGFTEEEVYQAMKEYGLEDQVQDVKLWYDGFKFGNQDNIYNPWSIANFLKFRELKPYWANTSSNQLAGELIQKGSADMKVVMEGLLRGETFWTAIDEQIAFQELDGGDEEVWSLLLASGYLKVVGYEVLKLEFGDWDEKYELSFTNLETRITFRKLIHGWFANKRYGYNDFMKALLAGDLDFMNIYLNQVVLRTVSHFDSGTKPSEQAEPERFYHGLVLGMIVDLDSRYVVTSNRESGFGRYDVLLEPRDRRDDGIIFEFKVFYPKRDADLQAAADAAVRQILDKKYADVLRAKGVPKEKIRIYGFAFQGKQVLIEGGYLSEQ